MKPLARKDGKPRKAAFRKAPPIGMCPIAPAHRVLREIKLQKKLLLSSIETLKADKRAKLPMKIVPGATGRLSLAEANDGYYVTEVCKDALRGDWWDELNRVKGGEVRRFSRVLGAVVS